MEEQKIWYSVREAAEFLGIKEHRLSRLRRQGRIKATGDDKYVLYHIDDLLKADTKDLRRKGENEPGGSKLSVSTYESRSSTGSLAVAS